MTDLAMCEVFKHVQTGIWLICCLVTLALVGTEPWREARPILRINVSLWVAGTLGMFLMTAMLSAEQLFPWGFKWWCGLAPILVCIAGTSILWTCHLAMSEINTKNNRRVSGLVNRKTEMFANK